ncbi:toxin co-regulated pilus biosynthesis Q family protein [Caballeronia sp. LjRoot34]|uniref:toxin co-regulated pilus biosynthesis Q family protein n=1 Tax=Caballeronia sp. LjRoot34 TaxID=3342325 RepID=UPI003ECD2B77
MAHATATLTRIVLATLCICVVSHANARSAADMHAAGCTAATSAAPQGVSYATAAAPASSVRFRCRTLRRHEGGRHDRRHANDATAGQREGSGGLSSVTVDAKQPVRGTAAPAAAESGFALQAGQSLQAQLQSWAMGAGWTVVWTSPDDWVVPGGQRYEGPFPDAARQVIEALALDGADIRADLYMGNRTLVVHVAGEDE